MYKLLIIALALLSVSAFSQSNRRSLRTYDCNMNSFRCGNHSSAQNTEITAYSSAMARTKCESLSQRKGLRYCGIDSYSSGYGSFTNYRCELARRYCGFAGGTYNVTISANSQYSAENKCANEANRRNDFYCRVSMVSRNPIYKTYSCHIDTGRRGRCHRPSITSITAISFTDATRKCQNKARNARRRFCRVVTR